MNKLIVHESSPAALNLNFQAGKPEVFKLHSPQTLAMPKQFLLNNKETSPSLEGLATASQEFKPTPLPKVKNNLEEALRGTDSMEDSTLKSEFSSFSVFCIPCQQKALKKNPSEHREEVVSKGKGNNTLLVQLPSHHCSRS